MTPNTAPHGPTASGRHVPETRSDGQASRPSAGGLTVTAPDLRGAFERLPAWAHGAPRWAWILVAIGVVLFVVGFGAYNANADAADACTTGTFGNWATIYDTPDCNAAWEATHDAQRVMVLAGLLTIGTSLAFYAGRNKPGQLGEGWLSPTMSTTDAAAETTGSGTRRDGRSTLRRTVDGVLMGLAGVTFMISTAHDAYELAGFSVTMRVLLGLVIIGYGGYILATRRPYVISRWIYVLPVCLVAFAFL